MSGAPERSEFSVVASESGAVPAADRNDVHSQLNFLNEVVRSLPASVTVQDERGNFVFVNDAAAAQFNTLVRDIVGTAPGATFHSKELNDRRDLAAGVLQSGRSRTSEEFVRTDLAAKVYLTTHKPLQIANQRMLLSSSVDLTQQKAIEEELFRCAYYDELTGLPTRRVIEQRANSLIREEGSTARFAVAFLDIDNFKHINDYYGHASGDALPRRSCQAPGPRPS